jgi:hypothetical protein
MEPPPPCFFLNLIMLFIELASARGIHQSQCRRTATPHIYLPANSGMNRFAGMFAPNELALMVRFP